jgi:signal recognition particle GTPase
MMINKFEYNDVIPNCNAEYKKTISDYDGNPLIEALPAILTKNEFIEAALYRPPFSNSDRFSAPEARLQSVLRILKYFQPMAKHIDLERKISMALRLGYQARNPLLPAYKARLRELKKAFAKEKSKEIEALTHLVINEDLPAPGFTMIGVSGVGKSTALKKILKLYQQVILHSEYKGKPLNLYQIVWVKIDCPHGGSLKDLCIEFFKEIDKLMGTNYQAKHGSKYNSDYLMLSQMCQIANDHLLGMLIIDEIQNLDQAKSGGKNQMLNFFVRLDNTIGVPVVVIGTSKATKILQGEFRQGRRREGIGSVYWDRFRFKNEEQMKAEKLPEDRRKIEIKKKAAWEFFITPLFDYQFTKESVDYDEEFSALLYNESQGVTDIAIKLFMLTQFRAIITNQTRISHSLMQKVAAEDLIFVRPMLDALRSGNPDRIAKYDDIKPLDINSIYKDYKIKQDLELQRKLEKQREKYKKQTNNAPELNELILELMELDIPTKQAKILAEKVYAERETEDTIVTLVKKAYQMELNHPLNPPKNEPKQAQKPKPEKLTKTYSTNDLRRITDEAKLSKVAAYKTLKDYEIIKNPIAEFVM